MSNPWRSQLVGIPDILSGFMKGQGLDYRMLELTLQTRWREIVGEQIGGHTYPDTIRFKKLYLVAENSVWLQQLTFLKQELLSKIKTFVGQDLIQDIVFRVGTLPQSISEQAEGPSEPDTSLLPSQTRAVVEETIHEITDPQLQARLRTLLLKAAATEGGSTSDQSSR